MLTFIAERKHWGKIFVIMCINNLSQILRSFFFPMKTIATEFYQQKHKIYLWKLTSTELAVLMLSSL